MRTTQKELLETIISIPIAVPGRCNGPPPAPGLHAINEISILPKPSLCVEGIDESRGYYQVDVFTLAELSNTEMNKRTVWRFHEASQWRCTCKGRKHADAIIETLYFRYLWPLPVLDRTLLRSELETGKIFTAGAARDGRPVLYLFIAKENTWDPRGNMQTLLYTMERCVRRMPPGVNELICLIDADDLGFTNAPTVQFIQETIEVLGRHYPRRMGQLFVCNVSAAVEWLWSLFSTSLSEVLCQY